MDFGSGVFKAVFLSVSIFCDAGFDLFGGNSLISFATNKVMNITLIIMMLISSVGFIVWDDITECLKDGIKNRRGIRKIVQSFSLHTKLVLITQYAIVIFGTIFFIIFEYNNLSMFSFGNKVWASLFQVVSAGTAGACTIAVPAIRDVTKFLMALIIFIGGSPGSLAGGIKTTTVAVLILGIIANVKGKKNISVFKKTITNENFQKAAIVLLIALTLLIVSNIIMLATSDLELVDLFFETASAYATNGLSCGAFANMNLISRTIIMLLMYIGRVGTMTVAVAFVVDTPKENDLVVYSKEEVVVG